MIELQSKTGVRLAELTRNQAATGARFVEIGNRRTTHLWELEAAIGPRPLTAAFNHAAAL